MGKKRKFVSRGERWSNGIITLDRGGREFDEETDAALIDAILRGGVFGGGLVLEVPTQDEIKRGAMEILAEAAGLRQAEDALTVEAIAVPPVDGNIDEAKELQEIADEARKRQEDAAEEARRIQERREFLAEKYAGRNKTKTEKPQTGTGKRRGRPPKNAMKTEG